MSNQRASPGESWVLSCASCCQNGPLQKLKIGAEFGADNFCDDLATGARNNFSSATEDFADPTKKFFQPHRVRDVP